MLSSVAALLLLAAPPPEPPWSSLSFLAGLWDGVGSGAPGEGKGGFSFTPELQGRVLVRRNYAEYPEAAGRAAFRHDDLTVIYRESADGPLRADYYDNEGHVIRYTVTTKGQTAIFLSEPVAGAPRYRLTYTSTGSDTLSILFEIAPPGKPDAFQTYIEAKARHAPAAAQ